MNSKAPLAVVILTYNVKALLVDCLNSVYEDPESKNWQVIVVDNASSDGTADEIKKKFKQVKLIENKENIGFAAGNNLALPFINSEHVLFLNPDTLVLDRAISKSLKFFSTQSEVGALTCRVDLPDSRLDYSCHRGLPTPWNSLMYFSGLAKRFPHYKFFASYTATYQDLSKPHEIECGSGTFFMVKWEAGQGVGWWDQDYWWNGEDIEFCYQLRSSGWKIYFYPDAKIIHYKSSSSGLWSTAKVKVDNETKIRSAKAAAQAMRIFYKKHYSGPLVWVVGKGIDMLEKRRLEKIEKGLKYE